MSGLAIRCRLPLADFVLDADLALPGGGVTALFGPSARARPRCCAVSPAWPDRRGGWDMFRTDSSVKSRVEKSEKETLAISAVIPPAQMPTP